MKTLPPRVALTAAQEQDIIAARVAFMNACPFFCYFYYDQLEEYPTDIIPTAATDGKRVFYNPTWFSSLRTLERCFVLAHEVYHAVWRHSTRIRYYNREKHIDGVPWDKDLFNIAADYVINADLVEQRIGLCNSEWLWDNSVKGTDKIEDVYKALWQLRSLRPTNNSGSTYGRGSQPDQTAKANGGRIDEVDEPYIDPVSGEVQEVGELTFNEAIARAAAAAKAMGNMPGSLQRLVDEILTPQINWREHVRMLITGRMGNRRETWENPNRRRLVLNPIVYLPGKRGHGADLVAVWIENSGSIGQREYDAFFGEVGGILVDVRPKRLLVGWCDAAVRRTEWVSSLDEVYGILRGAIPGGGGTSFKPPFEWMESEKLIPETLIYLTDLLGPFPKPVEYPVVWCATTDKKAPFGETVRIKI